MQKHKILDQFIKKLKEDEPNSTLLFVIVAGSHFFELNSPNSDYDYRGVYLPSAEAFKLKDKDKLYKVHDYKTNDVGANSKEDVDCSFFSLPKFLELLKTGDFNMMEMLFTPKDKIIFDSKLMMELRESRHKLLVNDVESFLGFFKKEYRRYGVNIFHYDNKIKFIDFLKKLPLKDGKIRLKDHWDSLLEFNKTAEIMSFTESEIAKHKKKIPTVVVATRQFHDTTKIKYVINELETSLANHKVGHRQKKMAEQGKEFKGLYHAQRLMIEAKVLATKNTLPIPLPKKDKALLRSIKDGKISQDELFQLIEDSFIELNKIKENTVLNIDIVTRRIDKILFNLFATMELDFVLNDINDTPDLPNAKIYLVGGAVRDILLNKVPKDKDYVIVGAKEEDIKVLEDKGFKLVGADFPVFIHPETGMEFALARKERKVGSSHTDFEFDTKDVSLEEDLKRRDLTINSIAMDLRSKTLIDPFNGIMDIKRKVLKATSEAFKEDALRVLRVAKFSARYNFSVSDQLFNMCLDVVSSKELEKIHKNRIIAEMKSSLMGQDPAKFFKFLLDCGALDQTLPELSNLNKRSSKQFLKLCATLTKLKKESLSFLDRLSIICLFLTEEEIESFLSIDNGDKVKKLVDKKKYNFILGLKRNYQDVLNFSKLSNEDQLKVIKKLGLLKDSLLRQKTYKIISCFGVYDFHLDNVCLKLNEINYEKIVSSLKDKSKIKETIEKVQLMKLEEINDK